MTLQANMLVPGLGLLLLPAVYTMQCEGQGREVLKPPLGAMDVCMASERGSVRGAQIRGTGSRSSGSILLADSTCPVARSGDQELPTIILIEVVSFSSKDDQAKLANMPVSRRHGVSGPFQMLVQGDLTCQLNYRPKANESGEFVIGNGFWDNGLAKYKLTSARVLKFRELK